VIILVRADEVELIMNTDSLIELIITHMPKDKFSPLEGREMDRFSEEREEMKAHFREALLAALKEAMLEQLDKKLEEPGSTGSRTTELKAKKQLGEKAEEIVPAFDLQDVTSFHPRIRFYFVLRHVSEDGRRADFKVKESDEAWEKVSSEYPEASAQYKKHAIEQALSDINHKIEYQERLVENIRASVDEAKNERDELEIHNLVGHQNHLTHMETFRDLLIKELSTIE
jgi:hypothetical protein